MIIKEFLPNPTGKDATGEYITLFNNGKDAVTMIGWKLTNSSRKVFRLDSYTIPAGNALKFPYSVTKLALKNTGATVSLYNAHGTLIDSLNYRGTAVEGGIIGSGGLTAEVRDTLFTHLPESYPKNARETLYASPLVFMVLAGVILGGVAVWIIRRTTNN